MPSEPGDITTLLERLGQGSPEATNELIALLYERFRLRAHQRLRHERPGHSLATTDLTHEALLRLHKSGEFAKASDRHELFRAFARAMRQVLIDHARRRNSAKRGGGCPREELDDLVDEVSQAARIDALSLHEALEALAAYDPRAAQVVEMRFFGGFSMPEIAEALGVSLSTVEADSFFARGWLRDFLSSEGADDAPA
jgi:RNA polymerase sigma factor (TIGR02999 family)